MSMDKLFPNFDLRVSRQDLGFLVENMGGDAGPFQFVRELTQNSIEAVGRTSTEGKIHWTIDQDIYEQSNGEHKKLSLIDNGDGMTGEEIVLYINQLASSSSSDKTHTGNFGIGAKITAGVNNPHGLIYISWKNGVPAKAHFWKNPETGHYGLKPLMRSDGTEGSWTDIVETTKPSEIIGDHGTQVILLGKSEAHDTSVAPSNEDFSGKDWVARYLSSHYAQFLHDVEVRVSTVPGNGFKKGMHVLEREQYFNNNTIDNGTVKLPGVQAHWWLLKDDVKQHTPIENKGHIGVLFQGELYETRTRKPGHISLSQAGIVTGADRVVLYFEPRPTGNQKIKPSSARGGLLVNSKPVPMEEWTAAFLEKMPATLKDYVTQLLREAPEDVVHRLKKRLSGKDGLFTSSAYKGDPAGDVNVEISKDGNVQENPFVHLDGTGEGNGTKTPGPKIDGISGLGDRLKDIKNKTDKEKTASKVNSLVLPSTRWVTSENDQELEDSAAKYNQRSNQILINGNYRGYESILKYVQEQYATDPITSSKVHTCVQEFYSQILVQVVLGAEGLSENASTLRSEYMAKHTSPECFTAAVNARVEIYDNIVKSLRADGIKPLPKMAGNNGLTPGF